MSKYIVDGVDIGLDHCFRGEKLTREQLIQRVRAHGKLTGCDTTQDSNYHFYLWKDAKALIRLLEASEECKDTEVDSFGHYIVWNPNGPTNPSWTTDNYEDALKAAKALAAKKPGEEFYVMKAQSVSKAPISPVETVQC